MANKVILGADKWRFSLPFCPYHERILVLKALEKDYEPVVVLGPGSVTAGFNRQLLVADCPHPSYRVTLLCVSSVLGKAFPPEV